MLSVPITELKAKLSGLLAAVEAGETVAIMRRGCRVAMVRHSGHAPGRHSVVVSPS
jgi:antitoxin (DNA-binding transcriptional repressor) of toxin-antitoxin stability system